MILATSAKQLLNPLISQVPAITINNVNLFCFTSKLQYLCRINIKISI